MSDAFWKYLGVNMVQFGILFGIVLAAFQNLKTKVAAVASETTQQTGKIDLINAKSDALHEVVNSNNEKSVAAALKSSIETKNAEVTAGRLDERNIAAIVTAKVLEANAAQVGLLTGRLDRLETLLATLAVDGKKASEAGKEGG
jgi:hypothetical protein